MPNLFPNVIGLPLKGSRPYIHSTDLWNSLAQAVAPSLGMNGKLKVNIRKLSCTSVQLVPPEQMDEHIIVGDLTHTDSRTRFLIVQAAQPTIGNLPDHDDVLKDYIILQNGIAQVSPQHPASPVEGLVSGYKMLLTEMFPDIAKWLALSVNIPLSFQSAVSEKLTVSHKSDVAGKTFFAEVHDSSDTKVGQLTFMGVDQESYLDMEKSL